MCDKTYGCKCKFLPLLEAEYNMTPKYLIVAENNCIVKGTASLKSYVALSYPWGQTQTLRTKPEALCNYNNLVSLQQAILQQAILQIRYLP
jgi:hypothetical protein